MQQPQSAFYLTRKNWRFLAGGGLGKKFYLSKPIAGEDKVGCLGGIGGFLKTQSLINHMRDIISPRTTKI
jgi:hypothetical protein